MINVKDLCVHIFLIIIPSVYISFWITSFISPGSASKNKDTNQTTTTPAATANVSTKKKCARALKTALKVWQIASILVISCLDIYAFISYTMEYPGKSGWSHYNCFFQVMVNSSNPKRCVVAITSVYWQTFIHGRSNMNDFINDLAQREGLLFLIMRRTFFLTSAWINGSNLHMSFAKIFLQDALVIAAKQNTFPCKR